MKHPATNDVAPRVEDSNPFERYMRRVSPDLVGQHEVLHRILSGLTAQRHRSFQLVGLHALGTSTILRYLSHPRGMAETYLQYLTRPERSPLDLLMCDVDFALFPPSQNLATWLLRQLASHPHLERYRRVVRLEDLSTDKQRPLEGTPSGGADRMSPPVKMLLDLMVAVRQDGRHPVLLFDHFGMALREVDARQASELHSLLAHASIVTATEHPLREINKDAAASWFPHEMDLVFMPPLTATEARELLTTAFYYPGGHTRGQQDESKEYTFLIALTGRYPYFILRGAAVWFDLCRKWGSRAQSRDRAELVRPVLLASFEETYTHYWHEILPPQQKALFWLVGRVPGGAAKQATLLRLEELENMGLVMRERPGQDFEPVSRLWREHITRRMSEEASREQTETGGPPRTRKSRSPSGLPPLLDVLWDYLQERPNQVCTYEELLAAAWHFALVTPQHKHVLSATITRLRKELTRLGVRTGGRIVPHRNVGYEYRC